jgi:hypothetical protein
MKALKFLRWVCGLVLGSERLFVWKRMVACVAGERYPSFRSTAPVKMTAEEVS